MPYRPDQGTTPTNSSTAWPPARSPPSSGCWRRCSIPSPAPSPTPLTTTSRRAKTSAAPSPSPRLGRAAHARGDVISHDECPGQFGTSPQQISSACRTGQRSRPNRAVKDSEHEPHEADRLDAPRPKAQLRAIDRTNRRLRIFFHALAAFAATGDGDVKRLQGIEPPEFRLRVGDYRLRFHDYGHTLDPRRRSVRTTPRSLHR